MKTQSRVKTSHDEGGAPSFGPGSKTNSRIPHQVGASGEPTSAPIEIQGGGNTLGGFFPTNSARNQQDTSVKSRTT